MEAVEADSNYKIMKNRKENIPTRNFSISEFTELHHKLSALCFCVIKRIIKPLTEVITHFKL
jgi:hypothetical protein